MTFMDRMATAPISWGICEVPGWGHQLPVDRVLREMAETGFRSTELGSVGYLPLEPTGLCSVLGEHGMTLLAAFVPLVIHDEAEVAETIRQATEMAELLQAAGARYFNTAPVMTWDWGDRRPLSDAEWAHSMTMLNRVEEITQAHGLHQVIHSHYGIAVETKDEVRRVLDGCDVDFVLDTAHLAIGGYDPVDFVTEARDRVGLVHIKDLDMALTRRLNDGELSLMEAVQGGIFPSVGQGDLAIDKVITELERSGYDGWYVLEQDVAISGQEPAVGFGPVEGVRESVDYLRGLEQQQPI